MTQRNIRRGLLRGWVVLTVSWMISVLAFSAWRVFGEPPCYAFDSIALNASYHGVGADYVKQLSSELSADKTICGLQTSKELLGLERYAAEGAIDQVAFSWREPGGWSTKTPGALTHRIASRCGTRSRTALTIGAMADHDLHRDDLGFTGDEATVATAINLHASSPQARMLS